MQVMATSRETLIQVLVRLLSWSILHLTLPTLWMFVDWMFVFLAKEACDVCL
jgi:hypothetical protein